MAQVNLLDLKPVRNLQWETVENQLVVVLKPKFTQPWLAKHVLPKLKRPFYRVKLDDFGSLVWNCCDGKNTVEQIGATLKRKFGDQVEPVYDRLGEFLKILEQNKFITYQGIPL